MISLAISLLLIVSVLGSDLEVVYEWKQVEYDFPSEYNVSSAGFIPENNAILGIKIWKDTVFLTVPRWKDGVPFTLVRVSLESEGNPRSPKLVPFPSWQAQEIGNCSAIQNIQSMEVDPQGRMWIADIGTRNVRTGNPDRTCPPKLVVIDLENDNKVVRVHVFPDDVVSYSSGYLNDIVVDVVEWYAYFSDSNDAAIVVYNFEKNLSWKVKDDSMRRQTSDGSAVNGITLSPLDTFADTLFYCPQASNNFYSVPTMALKHPLSRGISRYVTNRGSKPTPSKVGGIVMDSSGVLYYGLQDLHAIARWNTTASATVQQEVVADDERTLQWPDTFCFDGKGYLWFVTNRLQNFGALDINDTNYRVIRMRTGTHSYMYSQQPELVVNRSDDLIMLSPQAL